MLPDVPDAILSDCAPAVDLPVNYTTRDFNRWANAMAEAIEVCNNDKAKLREVLRPTPPQ